MTLPVDPVVTASAYRAAARGTKIVLLSSVPQGMTYGRDYVNLVTDDLFQMGKRAADALAAAIGGNGKIAYFFHDANHYVTNQRDQAFPEHDHRQLPRHRRGREARNRRSEPSARCCRRGCSASRPRRRVCHVRPAARRGVLAALRAAEARR